MAKRWQRAVLHGSGREDHGASVSREQLSMPAAPTALFQANPREMFATSEQAYYDVSKTGRNS